MSGLWSDAAHWLSDAGSLAALAPHGRLRVGVAVGKARSAVWTTRDALGRPQGVTVEIARLIADMTDLDLELVEFDSSGAVIAAAATDAWDLAFAPVDDDRKAVVAFGAAYHLGVSTYLVPAASAIGGHDDVDRRGICVVGVEDTATIRSARKTLKHAAVMGVVTLDEALALFGEAKVNALALGREALGGLLPSFPNARILDGHFHAAATAVAVPKNALTACEIVSSLIEDMKLDGSLRRVFDRCGLKDAAVAPPGFRP